MQGIHEVEIPAAPAEVWRAITDPEWTPRWYHGLRIEGHWRSGGKLAFRFSDGSVGESATVLELDEGHRLVLEAHFEFDDTVKAEPPHQLVWDVEPAGRGTRLRLTFDIPEAAPQAGRLIGAEGAYNLHALRLLLDPAEQARLARRDIIGGVEIRDLTPDLVADYHRFFDEVAFQDNPVWQSCYCSETHFEPDPLRTTAGNRADMTRLVAASGVTALLAYADGGLVAWCNYGETTRLAGVMSKLGLDPADHEKVGSVACFVIASQYRRHGLAKSLLEAACARLAERGCTQVEAYPRRDAASDGSNYRGPLEMYLQAGFEPYREAGKTLIVRKSL